MATTLTTRTFEMMYYRTRGTYCNPAKKFLSYIDFSNMFAPVRTGRADANNTATAIYNRAIGNGATEEAALHAALFVFKYTASGEQAARKWFDELVAKQSENGNSEVEEELKLFGRDLEIYLNTYAMFDATKNGAFMPIINEYRINCIDRARQLKKKRTSKENTELVDAVIAALEDAESGAKALLKLCECFIEDTFDMTNEEQRTKVLEILKDYLPKPKPEEDPKDPDPTGPSDSGAVVTEPVEEPTEENEPEEDPKDPGPTEGPSDSGAVIEPLEEIFEPIEVANVRSEIRSPLETIATSNGGVNKKPIPDVEEACLFNGKEFSDSDLVTILKDKITVLEGRNVSRNSINMLLNLVMNNQDGFVTKLINLGAKIPLEIKEVKATKYTTDKNRFDTVFEVATDTEPIVFFYHWDPIHNEEGTAWAYDALVLPFDKVTLTKDAKTKKAEAEKKAKKNGKSNKQSKSKKKEEQVAPQPQAVTATA